jgi:predicted dinucleotide-utilizing enzyme
MYATLVNLCIAKMVKVRQSQSKKTASRISIFSGAIITLQIIGFFRLIGIFTVVHSVLNRKQNVQYFQKNITKN